MKIESIARDHLKRGLPALVIAFIAIGTAAYGKWGLRNKMLPQYTELLEQAQAEYDTIELADTPAQSLIHSGSTVDICYSRLDGMGATTDPWERLEFYESHVGNLEELASAIGDKPEGPGEETASAIAKFTEKRDRLLERLCNTDSDYKIAANLKVAGQQLDGQFQPAQAQSVLERLVELSSTPELPLEQKAELAKYITQLRFEVAWHRAESTGELPPTQSNLDPLWREIDPSWSNPMLELILASFCAPAEASNMAAKVLSTINEERSLNERFKDAIAAHCVQGNWSQLRELLSQKFAVASREEQFELRFTTARYIGRILYSKLGDSNTQWNSEAAAGLELAFELYPNLPMLNSILWDLGASHAEASEAFSPDLVEAILVSGSKHRFLVLALSNAIRGSTDASLNYLRFATEASEMETSYRLANIAILQSSVGASQNQQSLLDLLLAATRHNESTSGSKVEATNSSSKLQAQLALAAAHLQIALNQLGAAKESIEIARGAIGSTPSVQFAESRLRMLLARPQEKP
ncbi:MAG: hypothetical protein ACE361_09540 [Aureliella sp.]